MFTDTNLVLEDGATMGAFSATKLSSEYIDIETALPDWGVGKPLYMNVNVTTATAAASVGAVEFQGVLVPKVGLITGLSATVGIAATGCVITWTGGHGLTTGAPVILSNSGGALPTEITAGRTYYAIVLTTGTLTIATSLANALNGTGIGDVTGTGTGTHTLTIVPLVVGSSGLIPREMLAIGTCVRVRLNPQPWLISGGKLPIPGYRYLYAKYIEGTVSPVAAAVTLGKWDVQIVESVDAGDRHYPTSVEVIG